MASIIITNPKIIKYFNNHPVEPEHTILFFIELLEKLGDNINGTINAGINKQILEELNETTRLIKSMNENINKVNTDITNSLYLKMIELKKEYIEETKTVLLTNTNEKFTSLLERNNSLLLDKTTILFNELIPKSNITIYDSLNEKINYFQKEMKQETETILKQLNNSNENTSIEQYLNATEIKFTRLLQNLQQPIHMYINTSEERINKNISEISNITKENMVVQNKLYDEMNDFLNKYRVSNYKGSFSETQLNNVINSMFDDGEVISTGKQIASGDFILKRLNKPNIMFENKDYTEKVYDSEIKKFIRDAENLKMHSIFLSQKSGIVNKRNFQVECHKGLIFVYVHFVNYSPDKIRIAIDIIDNLDSKIKEYAEKDGVIDKSTLLDIYEEYQQLAVQKDALIGAHKEFGKKINGIIDNLQFNVLGKYLSGHFSCNLDTSKLANQLICDNCNVYTCTTVKSMSAHKRGCKSKIPTVTINS
jgi:hypothetical protein